jgi:hypothetical protein
MNALMKKEDAINNVKGTLHQAHLAAPVIWDISYIQRWDSITSV